METVVQLESDLKNERELKASTQDSLKTVRSELEDLSIEKEGLLSQLKAIQ